MNQSRNGDVDKLKKEDQKPWKDIFEDRFLFYNELLDDINRSHRLFQSNPSFFTSGVCLYLFIDDINNKNAILMLVF